MFTRPCRGLVLTCCICVLLALAACGKTESPKPGGGPTGVKPVAPTAPKGGIPFVSSGLALGKKWTASSSIEGWSDSGRMTDAPGNRIFFHTKEEESSWLDIDLETATPVSSVEVLNRTDCCGERAIPLIIELSTDHTTWKEVARRTEAFLDFRATFSTQNARYVRLRVPRRTHLHLERVGVR